MSVILPSDDDREVAVVLLEASGLLSNANPLKARLTEAAKARVCAWPPVDDEAELMELAHQTIEAAGS